MRKYFLIFLLLALIVNLCPRVGETQERRKVLEVVSFSQYGRIEIYNKVCYEIGETVFVYDTLFEAWIDGVPYKTPLLYRRRYFGEKKVAQQEAVADRKALFRLYIIEIMKNPWVKELEKDLVIIQNLMEGKIKATN